MKRGLIKTTRQGEQQLFEWTKDLVLSAPRWRTSLPVEKVTRLVELVDDGLNRRTISLRLGISMTSVTKYRRLSGRSGRKPDEET